MLIRFLRASFFGPARFLSSKPAGGSGEQEVFSMAPFLKRGSSLLEVRELLQQKKIDDARKLFEEIKALDPGNPWLIPYSQGLYPEDQSETPNKGPKQ